MCMTLMIDILYVIVYVHTIEEFQASEKYLQPNINNYPRL